MKKIWIFLLIVLGTVIGYGQDRVIIIKDYADQNGNVHSTFPSKVSIFQKMITLEMLGEDGDISKRTIEIVDYDDEQDGSRNYFVKEYDTDMNEFVFYLVVVDKKIGRHDFVVLYLPMYDQVLFYFVQADSKNGDMSEQIRKM